MASTNPPASSSSSLPPARQPPKTSQSFPPSAAAAKQLQQQPQQQPSASHKTDANAAFAFASSKKPEVSSFAPTPQIHVIASVHPENYKPPPPKWRMRLKNFLARSAANLFLIYPLRLMTPLCAVYVLVKLRPFFEYVRRHTLRGNRVFARWEAAVGGKSRRVASSLRSPGFLFFHWFFVVCLRFRSAFF